MTRSPPIDDLRQSLRERLLLGTASGTPHIAQYRGEASLKRWLRMVVDRTGPRVIPRGREIGGESAEPFFLQLATRDPELSYIKEFYRDEVKRAFDEAFMELPVEQRNLLRWHFIDRLSIDHLAKLRNCHRATVYRWIVAALNALHDAIKGSLARHLAVDSDEANSILLLVRSQIDLSIHRLLW